MSMPPRPLPMKHRPMAVPRFSSNQFPMITVKGTKEMKDTLRPTATDTAYRAAGVRHRE